MLGLCLPDCLAEPDELSPQSRRRSAGIGFRPEADLIKILSRIIPAADEGKVIQEQINELIIHKRACRLTACERCEDYAEIRDLLFKIFR